MKKLADEPPLPFYCQNTLVAFAIETKSVFKKLLLMSCFVQDNIFRYQRLFDEKVANEVEVEVEAEIDIIDTRRRPDVPMQMKSRQK